jgi:hypothetical protein
VGANSRRRGILLCGQYPGYKGPMQACCTTALSAHRPAVSDNLANVFPSQISMLDKDRSIDESDRYFRATGIAFHQRCELDSFQRGHDTFSPF